MFDAFAAGVPIIQSTQGWIKELLKNENCGLSVDPQKATEMQNAILKLFKEPELRNNMADNCRRLAKTDFNRKLLADKYIGEMVKVFKI